MPNTSRGSVRAALRASQWVCLFMKEDPYGDPAFFFHQINVHLEAHADNAADTYYMVEQSEDGVTWTQVLYPVATPLVPGGFVDFSATNSQRWVRVLLYSTANGGVDGTVLTPEAQVLPRLIEDASLACHSMCEHDCETGDETTGF